MANSIDGRLVSATNRTGLAGARVEAFPANQRQPQSLGEATTNVDGAFSIQVEPRAFARLLDGGVDVELRVFDTDGTQLTVRDPQPWNGRRANDPIVMVVEARLPDPPAGDVRIVQGTVADDGGIALAGVTVEARDHHISGAPTSLGTTTSGADGRYAISYDGSQLGGKAAADLSVAVRGQGADGAELATSDIAFQAPRLATVDVLVAADLAAAARPPEYDRLLAAAAPVVGDVALADLDADGVAYVAGRTGWDPRSVAMAAQAAHLGAGSQIPAAHYYALLRAGLPSDAAALGRVDDTQVASSLKQAMDIGVIAAGDVDATITAHRAQAGSVLADAKATNAVSSFGEMLALRLDPGQRDTFVDVYRTTAGDPATLWDGLAQRGFAQPIVTTLQRDAMLGALTMQNAPLIQRLTDQQGVASTADLVAKGFYTAEAWTQVVGQDVPEGVTADDYAAGLAAQVALEHPTLVTADLVRTAAVDVPAAGEVAAFLADHGDDRLGATPMRTWSRFADLSEEGRAGAQLVERLYQISPSNESMVALSKAGVTSAMQIAKLSPQAFVARYGEAFPDTTQARMAHAQAQAVHTTALHIATMYLAYRAAPNLYALTGSRGRVEVAADEAVPASATLDELFGAMDYCACEECRSVLSPAAYLVDLLESLDLDGLPHTKRNPIDVLLERRPDLQHLALSCENTNIALPYLDIVNEILEHYVVNGNLGAFTGHDMTDGATTNDLLADPQFVTDAAYVPLAAAVHPAGLPFDMALAHLRLLFRVWDTTLADALEVVAGDHAAARRERLGLNAAEHRILTDSTFRELAEYFGEPAGTTIDGLNAAIGTGAAFCARAGIRYTELAELLMARSVNPSITVVPLLQGLGVPIERIAARWNGDLDDAGLRALVPASVDLAAYGGDAVAWLDANGAAITALVTLTDVGDEPVCDFGLVELRTAVPAAGNANRPDALAYRRLQRFIALWRKLGWSIALTDRAVVAFLGTPPEQLTDANIDAAWAVMLDRLANLRALLDRRDVPARSIPDWLSVFEPGDAATRRATLARLLRAGTTDLDHLAEMSGLDPLADDLGSDEPSVNRLLALWDAVKGSSLKVADLDFLLRHDDPTGKFDVPVADLRRDVRTLREALSAVDADLAVAPASADVGAVRAKMAAVYDAGVTDWFFGIVGRTRTYTTPFVTGEESLSPKLTAVAPTLRIDPFRRELAVDGLLDAATAAALATAADGLTADDVEVATAPADLAAFVAALKAAVDALRAAGNADVAELTAEHPELGAIAPAVAAADPATQATTILGAVLPELRAGLKQLALRTGLAAITKADADIVDAICGPDVLHAESAPAQGVLADLLALEVVPSFDADGRVELLVDPPATGDIVFYVVAPTGTQVTLAVDGAPTIPTVAVGASGDVRGTATLTAGALANLDLTVAGLPAGQRAMLRWRSVGVGRSDVPPTKLYDAAAVRRAGRALARIRKLVQMQKALGLTGAEVTHLGTRTVETAAVWDALDVDGTITPADLQAQLARVAWLLWFAALKRDHEGEPGTLVELLVTPGLRNARGRSVLAGVMEWSETDLTAILAHLALTTDDLSSLANLRRVAEALAFVGDTLQPAADLVAWTTATPDNDLLRTIRDTLRGRMDAAAWQESMQSVSDQLRNARRDALVAYILHHRPPKPEITTADRLYEHFLVDVQMDACMQTSRIRLALSTIQLFVTRCLMNLEDDVSPDSIDEEHWQWMKRYRVWEANRKVFLFPENWLEPELRDGKSPFFRDLESELLKADITDEAAELAYLTYLKKLDDVARLHIVATYLEQGRAGNPDDDVLHVFGRTLGTTREHWYRRYEYGTWTPWEKIPLNIEGEVLVPVLWKSQLFVFWTTAVTKSNGGNSNKSAQDIADESWGQYALLDAEVTLHWGELYRGRWTSPKSTEATVSLAFTKMYEYDSRWLTISARTFTPTGLSERLLLNIGSTAASEDYIVVFTSKNAPPTVTVGADATLRDGVDRFNRNLFGGPDFVFFDANALVGSSGEVELQIDQPSGAAASVVGEVVMNRADTRGAWFRGVAATSPAENQWEVPLFYSDGHGVFVLIGDEEVKADPLRWYTDAFITDFGDQVLKIPPLYEVPQFKVRPKIGDIVDRITNPVVDPDPTAGVGIGVLGTRGVRDRVLDIDTVRIADTGAFDFRGTNITGALTRRSIGFREG